jgi:hypothetical protein
MGIERLDGKIQSGVQPLQSKKQGSGLNFFDSDFKFQISAFPESHATNYPPPLLSAFPPKPSTLDSGLMTQSPYLRNTPTAGFRLMD